MQSSFSTETAVQGSRGQSAENAEMRQVPDNMTIEVLKKY